MKFCIYWTCSRAARLRICEVLHVPVYLQVSGETFFTTENPGTIESLHDLQQRGYIQLRNKDEKTKCPI